MVLKTKIFEKNIIDKMFTIIEKEKTISLKELSQKLKFDQNKLENLANIFEKHRIINLDYNLISSPRIVLIKKLDETPEKEFKGEIIESYSLESDKINIPVKIYLNNVEKGYLYYIYPPKISKYTNILLKELHETIAEELPVDINELIDPDKTIILKDKFYKLAEELLKEYFSDKETINILINALLHRMYGLGKIEYLLKDNNLEEIAINSSKSPVTVYHRKLGWMKTNIFLENEDVIANYAAQIGRKVGREINVLNPILDAHLSSGDRVNATLEPISANGNTITIRRYSKKPWTVIDFIGKAHTMNSDMAALLWMAMHYELNIIVAGGTASGKTSTLNALSSFFPTNQKIISIEDVREIRLPKQLTWNWIPLITRTPNPEGLGAVEMLDLMEASLRMRPDRIIVGEIRRKKEAEVLFEAMHTGHSVYSTLHANSAYQVIRRLTEKPIEIPPLEIEAIDLLIVQYRDRRKNLRRTYEIAEIESGVNSDQLTINTIYKWSPRDDSFELISKPLKFLRTINLHTGLTEEEIYNDLNQRKTILEWMKNNEITNIDDVGKIFAYYYSNPTKVYLTAKNKKDPKEILEVSL